MSLYSPRNGFGHALEPEPEDWAPVVRPRIASYSPSYHVLKRILDLTVCLLVLPAALVAMGLISLAIWLESPGPVCFVQMRTGKGGRRFAMYKFRTMVPNAEALKEQYAHLNELTWPDFKITDDPRQTRVGRWLRKTSLDELPQIFNVLKGEMSLVGPRPTSFAASTYSLAQTERLEVLPGVTGLWQVHGRADVDFEERVGMDIDYIEQQSLWLDVRILCATVGAVMSHRGAY